MPREHLLREVGKNRSALGYKEIIDLKRLYRVSGAALLMRLRQLDVINQSILIYAFQTIARGWRKARAHDSLDRLPMSDGGDGFGEVTSALLAAKVQRVSAVDAAHCACVA